MARKDKKPKSNMTTVEFTDEEFDNLWMILQTDSTMTQNRIEEMLRSRHTGSIQGFAAQKLHDLSMLSRRLLHLQQLIDKLYLIREEAFAAAASKEVK